MPENIFYSVYKYDELSPESQEKACEKLYDINVNFGDWDDFILENWKAKLESMGFKGVKIYYSGFGSQGDGACFETTGIDPLAFLKYKKALTDPDFCLLVKYLRDEQVEIVLSITHHGHYYHAQSTWVEDAVYLYMDNPKVEDRVGPQADQFVRWIKNERIDLGNEIYHDLMQEYFYLISTKAIEDTIRANDYLFHEDGTLVSRQWDCHSLEEILEKIAI